jgi:putative colanic acid biosynthesis UDP-glucose lipid carrier transferase
MRRGLLREYANELILLLRLADIVLLAAAGVATYWAYLGTPLLPGRYRVAILLGVLLCMGAFEHMGVYRSWRDGRLRQEARLVCSAWLGSALLLAVIGFMLKVEGGFSRIWLVLWIVSGSALLCTLRLVLRSALQELRRRGWNQRRVIVVGSGPWAKAVCRHIVEHPSLGLQVAAAFGKPGDRTWVHPSVTEYHAEDDLASYIERHDVDEVWLAIPMEHKSRLQSAMKALEHSTANIRYAADLYHFNLLNHSVTEVGGMPVLNLSMSPMEGGSAIVKRLEDLVLSSVFLLVFSPLMLLIALGVKLTSPGPVFYRQIRVGWNGNNFEMLKFRSMPVDSEAAGVKWGAKSKQPTRLGAFLRKTSLDELPQFINVFLGDMSIVGPRPERPMFVDEFKHQVPFYMKKHLVKAGITGLAQVRGWRGDTDLGKRIESDIEYINNWSLLLDLKIIFLTPVKGLINVNAY